jgi:hypothetical protein
MIKVKGQGKKAKRSLLRFSSFLLPLAFLLCPRATWAVLRAGAAAVEITPPAGTPLGGYGDRRGAPSTGVHDPIHAKALVLSNGGDPVALVATDLIGTSAEIKRRVAERCGIPSERLLLTASHTHSGPGAFAPGPFAHAVLGEFDPKFRDWLADRIADSVTTARSRMQAARLGVESTQAPGLTRNRRGGTLTDPELTLLKVTTARGRPLAALLHFTAHGTVLGADNMQVSGDWQRALERRLGGRPVLYMNGAEGDQSPVATGKDRFQAAETLGRQVADAAWSLYPRIRTGNSVEIRSLLRPLALPVTTTSLLLGVGTTSALQALAVGDALFIGIPGELIVEPGLRLKKQARELGWKHPVIAGLANDHLGYFLTETEFRKGGYEASVSFFGPRFGDELVQEAEALIAAMGPGPDPKANHTDISTRKRERGESAKGEGTGGTAQGLERLELSRLERVHREVERLRAQARTVPRAGPYQDVRAAIHVHSYLSHDSRGTAEEIINGAKQAGVRVVFMTDHYTADRRFLQEALRGERDGILFIPGAELSQGLLTFRMERATWEAGASDAEVLAALQSAGGIAFVAHPESRTRWDLPFTGMEIYNTHADAEDNRSPGVPSTDEPAGLARWLALVEAARRYPREVFASIFDPPVENLAVWDRLNRTRHVVGIAGNDAHQNVGVTVLGGEDGTLEVVDALGKVLARPRARDLPLLLFGAALTPGQPFLKLQLDPYDISFGYVSTHLLVRSVSEADCFEALTQGRCYVAFDWLADPTGFRFTARAGRRSLEMGEEIRSRRARLQVETPIPAELRLLRNGQEIARASGRRLLREVREPGVYRAEAWLEVAGEARPWIYSNPIYLRQ